MCWGSSTGVPDNLSRVSSGGISHQLHFPTTLFTVMKHKLLLSAITLSLAGPAFSQGLYDTGVEAQESLPLKWVVGINLIYDDNVSPGYNDKQDSLATNAYVGVSFVSISPQTTWDVYARLGLVYYFDASEYMDEVNQQSRVGVNLTHRFSERLRFSSRNFISYELEPDYSYGYASSRATGEYFYWMTDNSIGYRWSERVGTYTGLRLSGTTYPDIDNNDRLSWQLYNQFRYQLTPQTVLTSDYRYGQTSGDGASTDSTDQFFLVGAEHRFSPNTIGIIRTGVQFRTTDDGDDQTSPYLELAFNSQLSQQLRVRAFARYGIESYDTVQFVSGGLVEYDDRRTLRLGITGEYVVNPMVSLVGGVDYIPVTYASPRSLETPPIGNLKELDERVISAHIGFSIRFNDMLTGTASYNYTNSTSDISAGRDYDRNRISIGVNAAF